jgi:hypothetical protein
MKTRVMAAALWGICAVAQADVIDFNPADPVCNNSSTGNGGIVACGDYGYIAQSYGDVAGVLDVQYSAPRIEDRTLRWWDANYNNLGGVAWADNNDPDSKGRIDLVPLNGQGVMLTHFDLGAYPNTSRSTTLTITAIGGPVLYGPTTGNVGGLPGNLPSSFDGAWYGANGIRIEWQDSAYNVGIDNITYQMAVAVPEPAAFMMMAVGLVCLGGIARHVKSEPFKKEE